MEKIFVNCRELSKLIGVPPFTIRKKAREKDFPAYKMGKNYLFKVSEICALIEKGKTC